jgi:hypothetical protein
MQGRENEMDLKQQKFTSAEVIPKAAMGSWESFIQKGWRIFCGQKINFQKEEKMKEGGRMKACENHTEAIVVFGGDSCPLCRAEKKLKTVWEEVEKSMVIMKQIKMTAEEAGLKFV